MSSCGARSRPPARPRGRRDPNTADAKKLLDSFMNLLPHGNNPFSEWTGDVWHSCGKSVANKLKEISSANRMELRVIQQERLRAAVGDVSSEEESKVLPVVVQQEQSTAHRKKVRKTPNPCYSSGASCPSQHC